MVGESEQQRQIEGSLQGGMKSDRARSLMRENGLVLLAIISSWQMLLSLYIMCRRMGGSYFMPRLLQYIYYSSLIWEDQHVAFTAMISLFNSC